MKQYRYRAIDRDGVEITASIRGFDPEDAIRQITLRGYEPLAVEEIEVGEVIPPMATTLLNEPAAPVAAADEPTHPEPMFPPRSLPDSVRGLFYPFKNPFVAVGLPFAAIGAVVAATFALTGMGWALLFPLVFVAVGVGIASIGVRPARRRRLAWRTGLVQPGVITSVGVDPRVKVNGRSPFAIEYAFVVDGIDFTGSRSTFNPAITDYALHDPIWITYLSLDPSVNAVWPPIP